MIQTSQDKNNNNMMYQQILRILMWREMKDSEGELKMVTISSLFEYIIFLYRLKKT